MSVYSRFLFPFCVVLATACCSRTTIVPELPQSSLSVSDLGQAHFAEHLLESLISVRLAQGGPITGSGILLSLDGLPYMMTALHVVADFLLSKSPVEGVACHIDPYTRDEDCASVQLGAGYDQLVTFDPTVDAALVPLSHFPAGSRAVDLVEPGYDFRIGEEIWLVGCPLGNPNIATSGIVSGFVNDDAPRLFTDSDAWFGTSGGGVFLSTGEYVGYVHSMVGSATPTGMEVAEGLNVFSPLPMGWDLD